jgi:signal transduction histidine kinase
MEGRKRGFLVPIILVIVIFAATFSLYFYLREVTEDNVRTTLLRQYEQRQIDGTLSLGGSIGADLDLLMTKLQVLAEAGPVQAGDFASPETDALMKRIYDESNTISRVEGIGISNAANIVMNVYQPEVDRNRLIGQDMSTRPFAVEARGNLPEPTFSSGFETVINSQGQRMALLYPIYNQGTHIGWTRSAVDASLFFERYGNIHDIQSEYFMVLDRKGTILASPFTDLEGSNIDDEEVQETIVNGEGISAHLQKMLASQTVTALLERQGGETLTTGYPVVARGQPVYFVFVQTPTSLIYSQVEGTLFAQQIQTVALFAVSASAISILVIFLARMNSTLQRAIRERTGALEEASAKLESLNRELQEKNRQLSESYDEILEKERTVERAMTKVLEAEKAKDEFISMISHELRTPIVPIKGYAEMLLKTGVLGELNDKQRDAVNTVMKSSQRLEALVGDVMDVFKLDMGKMRLTMETVDAATLLKRVVSELGSIMEEKGVDVRADAADGITVICDARRIDQVLGNLIKNSVDFVPAKGGRILVKAEKAQTRQNMADEEKQMAIFTVEDNGQGIPRDKADRVFEKFYQVDASAARKHGGTGLGLVICKGIVEAHGGRIWVDTDYSSGASLKFSLPISP